MKWPDVTTSEGSATGTSSRLLRAAQEQDQVAWQHLVHLYSRRMYRWCRRADLQPADAANVVQEAFDAVARKLGDFRRDRPGDTFRGWLHRIVQNKIHDHYRRQGRRYDAPIGGTDAHQFLAAAVAAPNPVVPEESQLPDATSAVGRSQIESAIDVVRAAVGERNWLLFWRTAVDGQSAADVGEEFGATANAVRIAKMRVLRRLREEMGEQA